MVGKGVANGNIEEDSGANIEDERTWMGRDDKRNGTSNDISKEAVN